MIKLAANISSMAPQQRGTAGKSALAVDLGHLTSEKQADILNLLTWHSQLDELSHVDIAIEAVFEDLNLKRKVLKSLEESLRSDALIASNTSNLDLDAMSSELINKTRGLGCLSRSRRGRSSVLTDSRIYATH